MQVVVRFVFGVTPSRRLYVATTKSNPSISVQLQSKCTVIDFSVTMQGIEDQVLSVIIQHEQRALEEHMYAVLADVNTNTKVQDMNFVRTLFIRRQCTISWLC